MSFNINGTPVCGTVSILNSSTYAGANLVTFATPVYYLRLTEQAGHTVSCKINGLSTAVFTVPASGTVEIPLNAMAINKIDFANSSGSTATVQYIAGAIAG